MATYTYQVSVYSMSDEDGLEPGAFQAVLTAYDDAQLELMDTDNGVESWQIKVNGNIDRMLDIEPKVISYASDVDNSSS